MGINGVTQKGVSQCLQTTKCPKGPRGGGRVRKEGKVNGQVITGIADTNGVIKLCGKVKGVRVKVNTRKKGVEWGWGIGNWEEEQRKNLGPQNTPKN